ncbi:triose-phosphate isomerase [Patescibacteria group bacterium]|nr:triose-phosphate isomerase [Patescibacteria group bacterium]
MNPKNIIAANWKMNLTLGEAQELASGLDQYVRESEVDGEVVLCPTFIQLPKVTEFSTSITLGAQDVYFEDDGAFTGEISTAMLKEVSCRYVIVGHSERRHVLGESDELVSKKMQKVLNSNLDPIFCLGETIEDKEAKKTAELILSQLQAFDNLSAQEARRVVVAYEPVWAIGTGLTASLNDAETVIDLIRKNLQERYSADVANSISILYGGSVNEENIKEFAASQSINGVLVGGASLDFAKFSAIIKAYQK